MQVQMKYGLTGRLVAIHHNSISVIGNTFDLGYVCRRREQWPNFILRIVRFDVIDRRHVPSRDY